MAVCPLILILLHKSSQKCFCSRTGCQSRNISFLLFPGNLPFPSPLRSIIQIQAVCHHTGKTFSCIPSLSFSIFKYSFSVAWSSSSSFLSPPPPLLSSQPHVSDASSSWCPPLLTDTGSSPGAVMAPMRPSLPPHWTWSPFRIDFMSHIVARQKERCGNIFYSHQLCKIVTRAL